jgi:predicted amidophosphoribosyltransferase
MLDENRCPYCGGELDKWGRCLKCGRCSTCGRTK